MRVLVTSEQIISGGCTAVVAVVDIPGVTQLCRLGRRLRCWWVSCGRHRVGARVPRLSPRPIPPLPHPTQPPRELAAGEVGLLQRDAQDYSPQQDRSRQPHPPPSPPVLDTATEHSLPHGNGS